MCDYTFKVRKNKKQIRIKINYDTQTIENDVFTSGNSRESVK